MFHVYVVKLCSGEIPGGEAVPCVYVGETGLTPRRRFLRHKEGGRTSVREVRLYGLRLMPELTAGIGPFATREEALRAERDLAQSLRDRGFLVWGGQGDPFMDEPVERAVRGNMRAGHSIERGRRRPPIAIQSIDDDGLVCSFADGARETRITWRALEGAGRFLRARSDRWIPVGRAGVPGITLNRYLRRLTNQSIAGWVAAILVSTGLVETDGRRNESVRWSPTAGDSGETRI